MIIPSHVDIIFDGTLICPWDCEMCCVDAVHVQRRGEMISLRSNGLANEELIKFDRRGGAIYEQAARRRQNVGAEMTLAQKIAVLDNLEGFSAKLDLTGGDALVLPENMEFLRIASDRFGKENITLTVTAAGMKAPLDEVARLIGEFNFTYDAATLVDVSNRPKGYASSNLKLARKFADLGCATRAELPLTRSINSPEHLSRIYGQLSENGIGKLLLMRLFPSGRGRYVENDTPTNPEYLSAIRELRGLEQVLKGPKVKLQCALRHLDKNNAENPCDLMRESYGVTASGILLASAWAKGLNGTALDDAWVLGDLKTEKLKDILRGDRAQRYLGRLDENFGQCKIFSYLSSNKMVHEDRLFDNTDPLYAN